MREGPPLWLDPPALAQSAAYDVDDGRIHANVWTGGVRIVAEGYAEDDAAWICEPWQTVLPLESAMCLCNTLATGKDTAYEEEAWGRVYRRVYSFDSHTSDVETHPAARSLWFYPMNERRVVFRLRGYSLVPALMALLQWAEPALTHVDVSKQGAQRRLITRGLGLLDAALRRMGQP